nr:hypothetical protein [Nocardiopsis potens]
MFQVEFVSVEAEAVSGMLRCDGGVRSGRRKESAQLGDADLYLCPGGARRGFAPDGVDQLLQGDDVPLFEEEDSEEDLLAAGEERLLPGRRMDLERAENVESHFRGGGAGPGWKAVIGQDL